MQALFPNKCDATTKPANWHVRPAKSQISLGIHPVCSESLLCIQWVAKDPRFLHADGVDSDQTGRMPRLIWVFAGRTDNCVGFVMPRLKFLQFPLQYIIMATKTSIIYVPLADKRDLTSFCNKLTNTHLKKVLKITIFYCHSKRVRSCVMHSCISYLLNLQLFWAKVLWMLPWQLYFWDTPYS